MDNKWTSRILAILGIASLSIAVPMSIASAQSQKIDLTDQVNPFSDMSQYGVPPVQPAPYFGTSMIQDDVYFYIVQNKRYYKMQKSDMSLQTIGSLSVTNHRTFEAVNDLNKDFQPGKRSAQPAQYNETALMQDDLSLYIVQGRSFYKLRKSDMKIQKRGQLPSVPQINF